jgi:hypothetical protein
MGKINISFKFVVKQFSLLQNVGEHICHIVNLGFLHQFIGYENCIYIGYSNIYVLF